MYHNIRGVKMTPTSRRRNKIGLPVEGLNIALGRQIDFVGGLKIKSNKIQYGGRRHFGKRKYAITQPLFQTSLPHLVCWWPWTARNGPRCHFSATAKSKTKSKMATGSHLVQKFKVA